AGPDFRDANGGLVVRCQQMSLIGWLYRTTNDLIWCADSRNAREPGVSIGPLAVLALVGSLVASGLT
ncbi:MAG: hypothetical protein ACREEZ_10355, partial [Stellaceae bacterium]